MDMTAKLEQTLKNHRMDFKRLRDSIPKEIMTEDNNQTLATFCVKNEILLNKQIKDLNRGG